MRVAILLAAGGSRRFGPTSKLLARLRRRLVIDSALDALLSATVERRIVITGADRARIRHRVRRRAREAVQLVHNPDWRSGLGGSLAIAGKRLRPVDHVALIFLADTPLLAPGDADRVLRALRPGVASARPWWRGTPGHPVAVRRAVLGRVEHGDRGLGPALAGASAVRVRGHAGSIVDVDTRWLLRAARNRMRERSTPCRV